MKKFKAGCTCASYYSKLVDDLLRILPYTGRIVGTQGEGLCFFSDLNSRVSRIERAHVDYVISREIELQIGLKKDVDLPARVLAMVWARIYEPTYPEARQIKESGWEHYISGPPLPPLMPHFLTEAYSK